MQPESWGRLAAKGLADLIGDCPEWVLAVAGGLVAAAVAWL